MRILCLWVSEYYSGTTCERFLRPLKSLGYETDVFGLQSPGIEGAVLKAIRSKQYDFLLHVPHHGTFRTEIMEFISKESDVKTIAWNGDEWLWDTKQDQHIFNIKAHNYCITTDREYLKKYESIRYKNVFCESWGYSNADWLPRKTEKVFDVYFCGARTPDRDIYIKALLDNGIKVLVDGPGYGGKLPLNEMIERYRKAKIAVSFLFGSKENYNYFQIKARTFEIPSVKTFQLSEYSNKLEHYFEIGKDLDVFRNLDDLVKKVKYYLKDKNARENIAMQGHIKNKRYSYENIFQRVFGAICEKEKNFSLLDA